MCILGQKPPHGASREELYAAVQAAVQAAVPAVSPEEAAQNPALSLGLESSEIRPETDPSPPVTPILARPDSPAPGEAWLVDDDDDGKPESAAGE